MAKDNLIKEELKRHMELLEYTFYMEDEISKTDQDVDNLLLGAAELNEQDPVGDEEAEDPFADMAADDEGGEDDMFIDINPEDKEEEVEEDPRDSFGIEGKDTTGRNMAYTTFKKIESPIIDAYDLLSNSEDQEIFYDYLIANLKLYFDKFESEIQPNVDEPTNQAYDSASEQPSGGEEESGDTLDLEI